MMKRIIPTLVLMLLSYSASAAELTLFDVVLRTSTRASINEAVKRAGGRLQSKKPSMDIFDVSQIGLPGATKFEIVYLGDEVVMAQYEIDPYSSDNERLRKMIVAKYGQPRGERDFDGQRSSDGKHYWTFDNQMELVYDKGWGREHHLSYVNKSNEQRMSQLLKDAQDADARKAAQNKKNIF